MPASVSSTFIPQIRTVDALIVGGGPTGLIVCYVLLSAGLDVLAVEQHDKAHQAMYGRASMLYARSLEILDQLGLFDAISETGYIIKEALTYKDGEEFASRGWTSVFKALEGETHFDYSFGIRQKLSENAFRDAIDRLNSETVLAPAKLLDFSVDPLHDYPVLAKVETDGTVTDIRSKYIVGADGGRSTVRSLAGIPFPGTASPYRWIRLDAVVRTDMPAGRRGGISIESPSHGNILWHPADNGRTRIGFICPDELYGEHGEGITMDVVVAEAQKAMKPFSLEFLELDWWTVYSIGQRVAESFREGPILLAGDAGHTHSSGAAQGMNTGIHDASNLSWKLAGVIKGWYSDAILDTYATERRASAQQLIQLDKDISTLISGVIPAHFDAPADADVNVYFDEVLTTNASFTVGLGIHYEENLINRHNPYADDVAEHLLVGHRAPDPPLYRPGTRYPKRLQEFTPNRGRFWILVFTGGLDPASEQPHLHRGSIDRFAALRSYVESPASFASTLSPAFEFLTIVRGDMIMQTAETLGGRPLGRALYDRSGDAYERYGIDESAGAVVVLRPDGIVGFVTSMDQYEEVGKYFEAFLRPSKGLDAPKRRVRQPQPEKLAMGEISLEGRAEEMHLHSPS